MAPDRVDRVGRDPADDRLDVRFEAAPLFVEDALDAGNANRPRQDEGTDGGEDAAQMLERLDGADPSGGDPHQGDRLAGEDRARGGVTLRMAGNAAASSAATCEGEPSRIVEPGAPVL